ncbi:MAG: hypothetical protein KF768_12225 [Phycisphaeraceae bacterium]|nr:hypothetical protein [Phycisphaeraceae bacterium]
MVSLAAGSVLPWWIAVPVGMVTMTVIAGHLISLQWTEMSARRRRIRHVSGVLMMVVAALMAYALGGAEVVTSPATDPQAAGMFLKVWLAIVALLLIVVSLAVMDMGQTAREALEQRGRLRASLRSSLEAELKALRAEREQSRTAN